MIKILLRKCDVQGGLNVGFFFTPEVSSMNNQGEHGASKWRLPPLKDLVSHLETKSRPLLSSINSFSSLNDDQNASVSKNVLNRPINSSEFRYSETSKSLGKTSERFSRGSFDLQNPRDDMSSSGSDFDSKTRSKSPSRRNSLALSNLHNFKSIPSISDSLESTATKRLEVYSLHEKDNKTRKDSFAEKLYSSDSESANENLNQDSLNNKKSKNQSPGRQSKKYTCDICFSSFSRQHNLKSHTLTHSTERPFVCEICSKSFRRQHDLKRHKKLHTGERPHTCSICGRGFARLDALNRHMRAENMQSCSGTPRRGRFMNVHIGQGFSLNYIKGLGRNSISTQGSVPESFGNSKYFDPNDISGSDLSRRASTSVLMLKNSNSNNLQYNRTHRFSLAPPLLNHKNVFFSNQDPSDSRRSSGVYPLNKYHYSTENGQPSIINLSYPNSGQRNSFDYKSTNNSFRRSIHENSSPYYNEFSHNTQNMRQNPQYGLYNRINVAEPADPSVNVVDGKESFTNLSISKFYPKSRFNEIRFQEHSSSNLERRHSLASIGKSSTHPQSTFPQNHWSESRKSTSQYIKRSHPLSFSNETNQQPLSRNCESEASPALCDGVVKVPGTSHPSSSHHQNLTNPESIGYNFYQNISSESSHALSSTGNLHNLSVDTEDNILNTKPPDTFREPNEIKNEAIPNTSNNDLEEENLVLKHELEKLKSSDLYSKISNLESTIDLLTQKNNNLNEKISIYERDDLCMKNKKSAV
ncbi:Transcriptional regulator CRZ1 [Smittium mucronatum]|uniref:Transcriptional regulator CRZ1 n=1 Tax=Smittium mucronatum TaxID=133383 RepID=A0A1R0GSC8_9FUNG|nr:Transcriptional regulator CRZ1 [Smittium mucronatum]